MYSTPLGEGLCGDAAERHGHGSGSARAMAMTGIVEARVEAAPQTSYPQNVKPWPPGT